MATSGSTDFSINRTDVIQRALRRTNILGEGQTASSLMEADAVMNLNLLVKEWMNLGYNMWTYTEQYVFPVANQTTYQLSVTGAKSAYESDYVRSEMRVAATAGITTMEIDSTVGMLAADTIGVLMDTNLIHWTTIASITDTDTLELTVALTSAAAVNQTVHTYTTIPDTPLRTEKARRVTKDNKHIPIDIVARDIYNDLPDKTTAGVVNQIFLDRQLLTHDVKVWPVPANENEILLLTVQRKLEDFDAAANNPDFPVEWGNALIWGLAESLAHEYMVEDTILKRIQYQASRSLNTALNFFDRDDTSIFFQPEMIGR